MNKCLPLIRTPLSESKPHPTCRTRGYRARLAITYAIVDFGTQIICSNTGKRSAVKVIADIAATGRRDSLAIDNPPQARSELYLLRTGDYTQNPPLFARLSGMNQLLQLAKIGLGRVRHHTKSH